LKNNIYTFKNEKIGNYTFFLDENSFIPTHTTSMIVNASLKNINSNGKLLDLGCGCGIVGIILGKCIKHDVELYASDISDTVEEIVNRNAAEHKVNIKVKKSNIFEEWNNMKFDYIINDISGVSSLVANLSPWFKNISCESGDGGDLLVNQVIHKSKNYLSKNGKLFFPVISLSDKNSIVNQAKKNFTNVFLLDYQEWPVPKEMMEHAVLLRDLKKKGKIFFQEKFGILIGSTEVYVAYN